MPEREVTQTLASYVDEDGARRYALAGETVTVHPDHVKAFDELNGESESKPAKKAARKAT